MKPLLCILWVSIFAHSQTVTVPTYSSQRVDALVHAIAHAEGFGIPHALPTRCHNPGDLKSHAHYRYFRTDAAGFQALTGQIVLIIEGRSRNYTLDMTIKQLARKYASSARWAKNVSTSLGVPKTTTLRTWLCNGNVDVPPQIKFTEATS